MNRRSRAMTAGIAAIVLARFARADESLSTAVVDKFAQCFTASGGTLSEEDRGALETEGGDLALALDVQVNGVSCGQAPDSTLAPPSAAACSAAIQALPCDDLAGDLSAEIDAPGALGPPPQWAVSYVSALTGKSTECYAAEVGGPPSDEERAQVEGFGQQLAAGIGAAGSNGACTVHEDRLTTCTDWIRARPCDALLSDLTNLMGEGDAAQGDGAAPEAPDVDSLSDEELDARLGAAQSDRQTMARQLIGPCAELIDCATDLDAKLDAPAPADDTAP